MSHLLDIIIPEYNCDEAYMNRLLNSIIRQKNVDLKNIGIIIVNDNSSIKYKKGFFKKYPQLNIDYYIKDKNEGVGLTRQFGLNKSAASYVTFVDQDDELFGDNTLANIINTLINNKPELLLTRYVEEVLYNNEIKEILHEPFGTKESLHGVFINRSKMIENDICFVAGIRYHDDFYIRRILTTMLNVSIDNTITYLWKYNQTSIVRRDRSTSYQIETFQDIYNAVDARIEYFDKKNISVNELSVTSIIFLLIILKCDNSYIDNDTYKKYEELVYKLICKNSNKIESVKSKLDLYTKKQFDYYTKNRNVDFEIVDIYSFIEEVKNLYPNYKYETNESTPILDIVVIANDNELLTKTLDSIFQQINYDRNKITIKIIDTNGNIQLDKKYLNGEYKNYINIKVDLFVDKSNDMNSLLNNIKISDVIHILFLNNGDVFYTDKSLFNILNNLKNDNNLILKKAIFDSVNNQYCIVKNDYFYGNSYNTLDFKQLRNEINDKKDFYYIYEELLNSKNKENLDIYVIRNELNDIDTISIVNSYISLAYIYTNSELLCIYIYKAFILLESNLLFETNIDKYEKIIYELFLNNSVTYDKKIFDNCAKYLINKFNIKEIRNDFNSFIKKYDK